MDALGPFWGPFKRFWLKLFNWLRLLNVAKYASMILKSKEKTEIPGFFYFYGRGFDSRRLHQKVLIIPITYHFLRASSLVAKWLQSYLGLVGHGHTVRGLRRLGCISSDQMLYWFYVQCLFV